MQGQGSNRVDLVIASEPPGEQQTDWRTGRMDDGENKRPYQRKGKNYYNYNF